MNYDFGELKNKLSEVSSWLTLEYKAISTGRASPSVLDNLSVESYGNRSAISHIASITIEDPRTLRVSPWDKNNIKAIEKSIDEANLGLSVSSDDSGIRVYFPQLTTETRTRLVKVLKEKLEEARVKVRSVRETTLKDIDLKESEGGMSADDKQRLKDEVQKNIVEANDTLEALFSKKESDTMTI